MSEQRRNDDPSLRHAWHALCRSSDVGATPRSERLFGEAWVLWRDLSDEVRAFRD